MRLDTLLEELEKLCDCGLDDNDHVDVLCIYCESREQLKAQQRTLKLLTDRMNIAQQARLTWAMVCECTCAACERFSSVIRKVSLPMTPTHASQILCDNSPRCDEHCAHTSTGEQNNG